MTLRLCIRCRSMKNIKGKKIVCKRCEDELHKIDKKRIGELA